MGTSSHPLSQLAESNQILIGKQAAADAALVDARRNSYHPVRNYLHSIAVRLDPHEWENLGFCFFGTNDPWVTKHLQRQLIGLVARVENPGCKFDTSLILKGPQGIGKSTTWGVLGGEWFSDSLGDLRNLREDRIQLHGAWIHEWGEIDRVMGKRESEAVKAFLSATRDDVRKPYGRGIETLLRCCGIVGTTNRDDFIKDHTGNRRYPIAEIEQVFTDWLIDHRDAIWGSALEAYQQGTPWHYTKEEQEVIDANARGYLADSLLRDAIETWQEDNPKIDQVVIPFLVHSIDPDRMGDANFSRDVARQLTILGWHNTKLRRRGYLPNNTKHNIATVWEKNAA